MSDDTPKWDCEIINGYGNPILSTSEFEEIDQYKDYIGKIMRISEIADMITNSEYYDEYDIYNYFCDTWGYVGKFMFEVTPDTRFQELGVYFHLGKLIAVLDKKK